MEGSDRELVEFFALISQDMRIGCAHISLYVALCVEASHCNGASPLIINGGRLIKNARISRRTYDKCIRELMEFGYIRYEPSKDPAKGSRVYFNKLL